MIYILANNLYEADMPWLLRNYSGFSDEVKKAVLQVASNMVDQIASTYSDEVDNVLLDQLFRSERVDFEGKIQLLEKTANSMSKEKLCVVLRKRAKITEENKQILQALYNSGVISKPVPAADGQTYKTIRYCHKIVNDSLPSALL